jgi:UDPglucose 6-dehydrogenase
MTICVFGLWHLGCVTAACVAERYRVIALDPSADTISGLRVAQAPIFEPGLREMTQTGLSSGSLQFTSEIAAAAAADIVWVTFDTPVNESDEADFQYVESQIASLFPHLRAECVVLISSQMPVGTTARIEKRYRTEFPSGSVHFAYSPENLRLGKALSVFRNPGRIVIGVHDQAVRDRLAAFLSPFCQNLIWMSVESAEMTKHALNSFLANSIVFMNEVATLCEQVGADAKQVEAGLKSEERIGPGAYLSPGGAFAGGTLARDVSFLVNRAADVGVPVPLLESIRESNEFHKSWPRRKLKALLGSLAGKKIALLGLTYKPGTDTLRRSAAVELGRWLVSERATVSAFDPAVKHLPAGFDLEVTLCESALDAIENSDAAIIATEWPEFRSLRAPDFIAKMSTPLLVDSNRFLEKYLDLSPPLRYVALGRPAESL